VLFLPYFAHGRNDDVETGYADTAVAARRGVDKDGGVWSRLPSASNKYAHANARQNHPHGTDPGDDVIVSVPVGEDAAAL
jgi:hypothetical protein